MGRQYNLYWYNGDAVPSQQSEAQTIQGIARASLRVDRSGTISIRAQSDPATLSELLTYEIPFENITSTPPPPTSTPTPSPTATEVPTETPTNTPSPTPTPIVVGPRGQVNLGDWLGSFLVASLIGGANYWLISQKRGLLWGVRGGLITLACGLLAYIYLALDLPGSKILIENAGIFGVLVVAALGAAIGASAAWAWQLWKTRQQSTA